MRDYVQYHNIDKLGYDCHTLPEPVAYTKKRPPKDIIGKRIWLISGKSISGLKGKRYYLNYVFLASAVRDSSEPGFQFEIQGALLERAARPIPIYCESWFPDFLRGVTNFSRGLTLIDSGMADDLSAAMGVS